MSCQVIIISFAVLPHSVPSLLPHFLPLAPLLNTLGKAVDPILQPIRQAHYAIANRLSASGVVDCVADSAACGSYDATGSPRDAADECTDLDEGVRLSPEMALGRKI